jgi:hypothetical protein
VTRSPTNPDAGGDGTETGHVFGQDGDAVREFRGLNFVYHSLETKKGQFSHRGGEGDFES